VTLFRLASLKISVASLLVVTSLHCLSANALTSRLLSQTPEPQSSLQTPSQSCRPENSQHENQDSPISPALFKHSGSKFSVERLMSILRDTRHEGWIRTAYPDPTTGRPLIGGGFSLDVCATEHAQRNPLNPNEFLEPSSAQLWQAAGLDLAQLSAILDRFDRRVELWGKQELRRKIRAHELPPDITEEEAMRLLRISVLQAVHNARAYSINFDHLSASQQMALTQLVYQMGVNLEEFTEFLSAINSHPSDSHNKPAAQKVDWKTAQRDLVESEWARRYTNRAIAVIAMFDPNYGSRPKQAERQVHAWIYPQAASRRKNAHGKKTRTELARNSPRRSSKRRAKQG
jgi:hypothetical protein